MATSTLASRIKKYRKGELLTPLIDAYFRRASMTGGVKFQPETMRILNSLFLKPQRDRTGSFSASGLSSCMRAQILSYNGEEQEVIPSETREAIFFNGHWLHLKWQGIFLELGIVRQDPLHGPEGIEGHRPALEYPVHVPKWNLRGSLDAVCLLEDEPWIVDVKGVGLHYWNLMKGGDIPRAYLWQQQAYMRATSIPRAMLLLENKGTGEYHEIHMPPPSSRIARQMEARVRALNWHLEHEKLPDKLPQFPNDKECRECPFRLTCPDATWKGGEEIAI